MSLMCIDLYETDGLLLFRSKSIIFQTLDLERVIEKAENIFNFYLDFNWEFRFIETKIRILFDIHFLILSNIFLLNCYLFVRKTRCSSYFLTICDLDITTHFPPLSGPSRLISPSALSLERCFSTAFCVIPITSDNFRAE